MRTLPITVYCKNCARDDDDILVRALASVHWADQKLFLSDKSKESSKELARKFGWEIHEWTGPNSMAERRNYITAYRGNDDYKPYWTQDAGLSANVPTIRNKLIMQLDSDEVYEWDSYHILKIILKHGEWEQYKSFSFKLINIKMDATTQSEIPLERMWKVGEIHWEKSIQNNPISDHTEFVIPVKVYHYGYGDHSKHQIKQWQRMPFNEEEVSKDPDEMHTLMYLINCLAISSGGQPSQSQRMLALVDVFIGDYDKSVKGIEEKHLLEKVMRFLWCASPTPEQRMAYLERQIKYYQDTKHHPDTDWRLWDVYKEFGDLRKGIEYGEKFLRRILKFDPLQQRVAMEVSTAGEQDEVKGWLIAASEKVVEISNNPKEKKLYSKKAKYWRNK